MEEDGKWVTINGAHVFIKNGQNPMDAFIRQKSKKDIKLYRAGTEKGQLDSGTFFSPDETEASNYGEVKQYTIDKSTNLFEGYSSQEYAKENNLMNKKYEKIKEKLGVDTLQEVENIYNDWITPSYLDKNPNLYFYAYQIVAKEELEKKGFDGVHWKNEDDFTPEQYQVWNKNKIK